MLGIDLSESTIERTTEAEGGRVAKHLHARKTFGQTQAWHGHRDTHGKTCADVSLDATGIRQQGVHGARAEGKLASVGMIIRVRRIKNRRVAVRKSRIKCGI